MEKKVKEYIPQVKLQKIPSDFEKVKISSPADAASYIRNFFSDDISLFESCFILLLDRANHTIGYAKISQGGVAGTVVDPKIVARYAISDLASSVILAHNHPSGNKNPSDADIKLTKKVKSGLELLDVTLMDHLIITETDYTSIMDKCLV